MSDVLTRICDDKRLHVAAQRASWPLAEVEATAKKASPNNSLRASKTVVSD